MNNKTQRLTTASDSGLLDVAATPFASVQPYDQWLRMMRIVFDQARSFRECMEQPKLAEPLYQDAEQAFMELAEGSPAYLGVVFAGEDPQQPFALLQLPMQLLERHTEPRAAS